MSHKLSIGEAIDVSKMKRIGPYYVLPKFVQGKDYCNSETEKWIWSIGVAEANLRGTFQGILYAIPKGTILASHYTDLYDCDGINCLWLR